MQLNDQHIAADDFSDKASCEVDRLFQASMSSIDLMGFNAPKMIAHWNEDFLQEQKECK